MYKRLHHFIFQFAKKVGVIYTLAQNVPNHITKVDNEGLYVETKESRNKYVNGGKDKPYGIVKQEWVLGALDILIENKSCLNQDLINFGRRHSFLMALLAALPFAEIDTSESELAVRLKKFTTTNLDPVNFTISSSESANKMKGAVENPFIKLMYDMLFYMDGVTVKLKRETLLEAIFLTTVSSTTGTTITESVAKLRLGNALEWLKKTKLIDQNFNVINRQVETTRARSYWWVSHGKNVERETAGGYLWAPTKSKTGAVLRQYTNLTKSKIGDIVFAYANGEIHSICIVIDEAKLAKKPSTYDSDQWGDDGNQLNVKYYKLHKPILKDEIPLEWRLQSNVPFDKNGNVKMEYFLPLKDEFAYKLINRFRSNIPIELLNTILQVESENFPTQFESSSDLISYIHSYITNKGFHFTKESITNFYLCLKTKPFIIFSGISGTGKTKIVQLFAESVGATDENGRFTLIPVRPDWSDGSDLIGYEDIKGDFKPGPFTKVLMEANKPENHDNPFFILLDEMNLARVEYYFSDLLSVMESREKVNGEFVSTPVIDREEVGRLLLRNNVYIVGTVNMDETTYPFSPKVLDRANTIEYNEVQLDHFSFFEEIEEVISATVANDQLAGEFITLKDAFSEHEQLIREITNWLVQLNQILEKVKLHFGYRVRDEVCFYMIHNEKGQLMTKEQAFDLQLHQKILPRISGNDYKTQAVLKELFAFCTAHMWEEGSTNNAIMESRFPKSAEKLADMILKIENDGFTSFWG
ncbi:McrB family protein [Lederbergia citrea]|uniref:McrB family protein n=1 Tax=Lederbergia citrea TaxID=2833581 RepID=UPI001BC8DCF1|nr:hypothetical protein [Lederbergia citrea]MBS4178772.1 hypothetical protein [Lederbergia citrea]